MKIRGNTVGTTLKPEKAVVKCQNLTEEEKAQARKNIGAAAEGSGAGGGATVDEVIEELGKTRIPYMTVDDAEVKRVLISYVGGEGINVEHAGQNVLNFNETADGNNVILRGIAAAGQDTDAVNLGQMKEYVAENAGGGTGGGGDVVCTIPWEFGSEQQIYYTTGETAASGAYNCTDYVDISSCKDITYKRVMTTAGAITSGMAFYDENYSYISGIQSAVSQPEYGYTDYTTPVPENAVYARFSYFRDTVTFGLFELSGTCVNGGNTGASADVDKTLTKSGASADAKVTGDKIRALESAIFEPALGLHVIPDSVGMLNAIKRARQITDVKWTPSVNIPRTSLVTGDTYDAVGWHEDVFKKDVLYTGVPYSATETEAAEQFGYTRMHIGFEVPLETFVTAVCNPNSVVSKQSAYHNGTTACVYGLTCTSFISYVYGFPKYYSTGNIQSVSGMTLIGNLSTNINSLKLCDMLIYSGHHAVLVTDIIKSSTGETLLVEISELEVNGKYLHGSSGSNYGGIARRKLWNVDDLLEYFTNFVVYRYALLDSVTYTPNKYAPIEANGVLPDDPYLPCIPYMGDKFNYKAGYIPNSTLLTSGGFFTHIRVEKDGVVFNSDGSQNHYVIGNDGITEIGFTEIGEYKAMPCSQSGGVWRYGKSCSWSVIE